MMNVKQITLAVLVLLVSFVSIDAQELKFTEMDKSPLDAATYPRGAAWRNYLTGDAAKTPLKIKVVYSRPYKKDREIFGKLVPHGEDWRLGANEATEVLFNVPVEIGGKFINNGYYTLFAETHANHWIIKISTERHIGGTKNRDTSKDVVAVKVPVTKMPESREMFTIGFQKVDEDHCNMVFEWDKTRAALPISFNPVYLSTEDKSPMDLAQYPRNSRVRNYLEGAEKEAATPKVRVVYSRPQMKDRKIFGELLKYGEPWRLGANETTEITFFGDVKFGDKDIRRGRYGMMVVPHADKWEFVIHTNIPSWGTANHDPETNVASFTVPTAKTPKTLEALTIVFEKQNDGTIHMISGWENTMARVPITLK